MSITQAEIWHWHEAIVSDEWAPKYRLTQMARGHPQRFTELCHQLLRDPSPTVERVALEKLWEHGDSHDAAMWAATLAGTTDEALHTVVFEILRSTRPTEALPTLLALADAGVPDALSLASQLARTAEDRGNVLEVARRYLYFEGNDANGDDLRRAARGVVADGMDVSAWEDLYVDLARRFIDEDVIEALGSRATPRVIPALRDLLTAIGPGYVESRVLETAIRAIHARAAGTNEPAGTAGSPDSGADPVG